MMPLIISQPNNPELFIIRLLSRSKETTSRHEDACTRIKSCKIGDDP